MNILDFIHSFIEHEALLLFTALPPYLDMNKIRTVTSLSNIYGSRSTWATVRVCHTCQIRGTPSWKRRHISGIALQFGGILIHTRGLKGGDTCTPIEICTYVCVG
jgi:hypothetical protein